MAFGKRVEKVRKDVSKHSEAVDKVGEKFSGCTVVFYEYTTEKEKQVIIDFIRILEYVKIVKPSFHNDI